MDNCTQRYDDPQMNSFFNQLPPAIREMIVQSGIEVSSEPQLRALASSLTARRGDDFAR